MASPPLRVAVRRGLPLIIPGYLRILIHKGDQDVIRLVLTLLSVFRILKAIGVLKVNTITDPFTGTTEVLPRHQITLALARLRVARLSMQQVSRLRISTSGGPNHRVAVLGSTLDAYALSKNPELMSYLEQVSRHTGPGLFSLLQKEIESIPSWVSTLSSVMKGRLEDLTLGKLSEKLEAAGKIRLFAVADIWTQSVLSPLHEAIFSVLRNWQTDGTFDQLRPLKRLMSKGLMSFYSFDLSAATDRLPIKFQVQILAQVVGLDFAES